MASRVFIGTAGWCLPKAHAAHFAAEGSHLARYAARFPAVEINSTFYKPHQPKTFERWASTVPSSFRFAVKVPRLITHDLGLVGTMPLFQAFLDETAGLGRKRGPLLVQLAPSFELDRRVAGRFFRDVRRRYDGPLALEPRHPTWFAPEGQKLLWDAGVARVAADPARVPEARVPGGAPSLVYVRLHGSPRTYFSAYDDASIARETAALLASPARDAFCIFDNTALGHATGNALAALAQVTRRGTRARRPLRSPASRSA